MEKKEKECINIHKATRDFQNQIKFWLENEDNNFIKSCFDDQFIFEVSCFESDSNGKTLENYEREKGNYFYSITLDLSIHLNTNPVISVREINIGFFALSMDRMSTKNELNYENYNNDLNKIKKISLINKFYISRPFREKIYEFLAFQEMISFIYLNLDSDSIRIQIFESNFLLLSLARNLSLSLKRILKKSE